MFNIVRSQVKTFSPPYFKNTVDILSNDHDNESFSVFEIQSVLLNDTQINKYMKKI